MEIPKRPPDFQFAAASVVDSSRSLKFMYWFDEGIGLQSSSDDSQYLFRVKLVDGIIYWAPFYGTNWYKDTELVHKEYNKFLDSIILETE